MSYGLFEDNEADVTPTTVEFKNEHKIDVESLCLMSEEVAKNIGLRPGIHPSLIGTIGLPSKPPTTGYFNYTGTKVDTSKLTEEDLRNMLPGAPIRGDLSIGIQHDEDKLPYHLIPFDALEGAVQVFQHGTKEYEPRNWEKGIDWARQYASIFRHLTKWFVGQDVDPKSGLQHLDHAATRILMLSASVKRNIGTDDRVKL